MDKIKKIIIPGFVFLLFFLIFRGWFSLGVLSTGDWPFLFPKAIGELNPFSSWDALFTYELGEATIPKLWFNAYALSLAKIALIIPWPIFERLIWFFPYVIVSFISSYVLTRKVVGDKNISFIGPVVYSLNTYILMIVAGGQVGIMMAYAFLPLVFYTLLNLLESISLKKSLLFSLSLSFLIVLDLRVAYMFLTASLVLYLLNVLFLKVRLIKSFLFVYVIPGVVSLLIHAFWVLPVIVLGRNPIDDVPTIYTSAASLDFFSFAKLENSISLLHPNWPENIFGKVAFMRSEFLLIPVIAYMGLLWIDKEQKIKKITLLGFALLSVVGIFLSKGTNEPFGHIYSFLFNYIPGFIMFRDPTKWCMFVAVSYCLLIPYSLLKISAVVNGHMKTKYGIILVSSLFLLFWSYTIKDAIFQNLKGTLISKEIPAEYQKIAQNLTSDKNFYRILWVPYLPTFAYVSEIHPGIAGVPFFEATSTARLMQRIQENSSQELLQEASIKFVVVPNDTDKKLFLTDRKYDEREYLRTISTVKKANYLREVEGFGRTKVFEVSGSKDHFWSESKSLTIQYDYINPTKYKIILKDAAKGDRLVFSESYDKNWIAKIDDAQIVSTKKNMFNSFILPKDGNYNVEVLYESQKFVDMGLIVSFSSLIVIAVLLIRLRNAKLEK